MKKRIWLVVGVLVVATVVAGVMFYSRSRSERNTVRCAIGTWPGFASGFIGLEKGYFEGLDVHFTTMDDSNARHAAFQSGQIEVMISSADVFVQERAQGIEGVIFLITDESFGGDGIVAKQEIQQLAQLRDRQVAFARATPSHYLLYKALQHAGLKPQDIKAVVVEDPGNAGQAFVSGKVDAAVTWEPLLTQVKESGKGHILVTSRDLPGIIVDVLVASRSLAQDRDTLSKFTRGWMKSVQFISEHPVEAQNIIARGLKIPPEEAKGMMAGLRFADVERNRYFLSNGQNSPRLLGVLRDAGEFWHSQGIIQSVPPLDGLISDTFNSALPATTSKSR